MASTALLGCALDEVVVALAEDRVGGLPPDGTAFRKEHPMVTIDRFVTHDPLEDAMCEAMQRRLRDSPDNCPLTPAMREFAGRVGGVHVGFKTFHTLWTAQAQKHIVSLIDIPAPEHTGCTSRSMLLKYAIDYRCTDVAVAWVRRDAVVLRPQVGLDFQGYHVPGIPGSLLAHAHGRDRDMWVRLCCFAGEDAACDRPASWLRDAPLLALDDVRVLLREVVTSSPGADGWKVILPALDTAAARLEKTMGKQGAIRAWFACEFLPELSVAQLMRVLVGPPDDPDIAPWSLGVCRENHAVLSALVRAGRLHAACAVAGSLDLRTAQCATTFLAGDARGMGVLDELRVWWDAGASVTDAMSDVPRAQQEALEWPDALTPKELVTMLCRVCVLVARELCHGELDGMDSDDEETTVIRVSTQASTTALQDGMHNEAFSEEHKAFLAEHDAAPETVPFTVDWFRSEDAPKIRRPRRLRHVEFWRLHVRCGACLEAHLLHPGVELKLKDVLHLKDKVNWGSLTEKEKADILFRVIAGSQAPLDAATVKALDAMGVDVFKAVQCRVARLHTRCLALASRASAADGRVDELASRADAAESRAREAIARASAADARVDELAARLQRTQNSVAKLAVVLFGKGGHPLCRPENVGGGLGTPAEKAL